MVSASGPGVGDLDGHQHIIRAGLGVVHLGDPVPVAVERAGIQQLVLGLVPAPGGVDVDQVLVRERALRVVVAPPVPGVAGDRVQVPPVLLDVLAVVALRAGQPERPLLDDRVPPVPQRQPQAQPLLDVAEPGQPVLPPPVGPGPRLIMRQVIPRVAVRAVVLPDRAPLPLADIRPPPVPLPGLAQPVLQPPEPVHPLTFRAHHHSLTARQRAGRAPARPNPRPPPPGRTAAVPARTSRPARFRSWPARPSQILTHPRMIPGPRRRPRAPHRGTRHRPRARQHNQPPPRTRPHSTPSPTPRPTARQRDITPSLRKTDRRPDLTALHETQRMAATCRQASAWQEPEDAQPGSRQRPGKPATGPAGPRLARLRRLTELERNGHAISARP